jgi:hypothetical protein
MAMNVQEARADVAQKVIPVAGLSNIGHVSRDYQYHLEGKSDLKSHALNLTLWDQGLRPADVAMALCLSARRYQQVYNGVE